MVLALNIGNTNITIGGYRDGAQLFCGQLHTDEHATADEYAIRLQSLLALHNAAPALISGCILGSVVPPVTRRVLAALRLLTPVRILTVGPGLKCGLKLRLDNPAQLGADILCGVVAAVDRHEGPVVVINADTALSMMAANARRELVGGAITPSPHLSLSYMVKRTAQLPQVDPNGPVPASALGTNTASCLQSGVILGTAALLDGMAQHFTEALGPDTRFFATGSLPESILRACRTPIEYRNSLILDGLYAIWLRNRK